VRRTGHAPVVLWAACVLLSACGPRDRINARCDWTGDAGGALHLSEQADWQHLVADAQLAEDLAIRYDDAEEARGIFGPVGAQCLTTLLTIIRTRHGVTEVDVARARAHRNAGFDRAVLGFFVVSFAMATGFGCRMAHRRYLADSPGVRIGAAALVALAAGVIALPLSGLWIVTWELVRVGNDHLSAARAAKMPGEPVQAILVAVVLGFSFAALGGERSARRAGR
jgi:hypothetical protein